MKKDEIRRYRKKKRAHGECIECREKSEAWRCPMHAKRITRYRRAMYRRRRNAGLCARCGKVPPRDGRTDCESCAYQSKLYRELD